MNLQTFISDPERRASLAAACGTSADYLWQVATGWKGRKPSTRLAKRINEKTCGLISLESLRPDVWGDELRPDVFGQAPDEAEARDAA